MGPRRQARARLTDLRALPGHGPARSRVATVDEARTIAAMVYGDDEQESWRDQVTPPGDPEPDPRSMLGRRPGWYADPLSPDHHRWWTGEAWSEHTHPQGGPALPTPAEMIGKPRRRTGAVSQLGKAVLLVLMVLVGGLTLSLLAPKIVANLSITGTDPAPAPAATSAVPAEPAPVAAPIAALVGVPADATVTCPQGLDLSGPGRQAECTYKTAATLGSVTCERGESTTVCTVHDEITDVRTQTVCAVTGTALQCRPKARLPIPAG